MGSGKGNAEYSYLKKMKSYFKKETKKPLRLNVKALIVF